MAIYQVSTKFYTYIEAIKSKKDNRNISINISFHNTTALKTYSLSHAT